MHFVLVSRHHQQTTPPLVSDYSVINLPIAIVRRSWKYCTCRSKRSQQNFFLFNSNELTACSVCEQV